MPAREHPMTAQRCVMLATLKVHSLNTPIQLPTNVNANLVSLGVFVTLACLDISIFIVEAAFVASVLVTMFLVQVPTGEERR